MVTQRNLSNSSITSCPHCFSQVDARQKAWVFLAGKGGGGGLMGQFSS